MCKPLASSIHKPLHIHVQEKDFISSLCLKQYAKIGSKHCIFLFIFVKLNLQQKILMKPNMEPNAYYGLQLLGAIWSYQICLNKSSLFVDLNLLPTINICTFWWNRKATSTYGIQIWVFLFLKWRRKFYFWFSLKCSFNTDETAEKSPWFTSTPLPSPESSTILIGFTIGWRWDIESEYIALFNGKFMILQVFFIPFTIGRILRIYSNKLSNFLICSHGFGLFTIRMETRMFSMLVIMPISFLKNVEKKTTYFDNSVYSIEISHILQSTFWFDCKGKMRQS